MNPSSSHVTKSTPRIFPILRWVAVLIGLVTAGTGVAHIVGVASSRGGDGWEAFDSRYVHLLTIGGILVYVGLMNVAMSWWLGKGSRLALGTVTATTLALMTYLSLLLPLPDGGGSTSGFLILYGIYLAAQLYGWAKSFSKSRALQSQE